MEDWQLAYIAGLIDGEAHISIQREVNPRRKTPAYTIRFEIGMIDKQPLAFIQQFYPNSKLALYTNHKGRRLPYYRLRLYSDDLMDLFQKLLPYTQSKRRQLEICLEMHRLKKSYKPDKRHFGKPKFQATPEEFIPKAEALYWELRSLHLNKKPRNKQAVERFI